MSVQAGSDDSCYGYFSKFTICKAFANALLFEKGQHETLKYDEKWGWIVYDHELYIMLRGIKFCPYCNTKLPQP